MVARHLAGSSLRAPDGMRTRTMSPIRDSTMQELPAERDFAAVPGAQFEVVDRRTFRNVAEFRDVARTKSDVVADGHLAADGDALGSGHERGVAVGRLDASQRGAVTGLWTSSVTSQTTSFSRACGSFLEPVTGRGSAARNLALCTNSLTHDDSPQNAPRRMAASSAS